MSNLVVSPILLLTSIIFSLDTLLHAYSIACHAYGLGFVTVTLGAFHCA